MKTILDRLLIFAIGIPIIIALVVLLPYYHHFAVNVLITIISSIGAIEFAHILSKKNYSISDLEAAILGGLAPLAMTISVSFSVSMEITVAIILGGAIWVITSYSFASQDNIPNTIDRVTAGLSLLLYPGLLMMWIIKMTLLPNPTLIILTFLMMVFGNDSLAWATGLLFGNGNREVVPASPNKSIAGFIGGLLASMLIGIVAVQFFPASFSASKISPIISAILLGLVTGIFAIIGDLAESSIKRSANVKDSGGIIPGRGGILDSIDSISLAAPVFYFLYRILF